jgi:hypothetical protein
LNLAGEGNHGTFRRKEQFAEWLGADCHRGEHSRRWRIEDVPRKFVEEGKSEMTTESVQERNKKLVLEAAALQLRDVLFVQDQRIHFAPQVSSASFHCN